MVVTNKCLTFAKNVENMINPTISKIHIAIVTILFLASCSHPFSPSLKEVDKILFTDSQKGEALLDSIYLATPDLPTLDKKYYQLLKLKAADKAFRPIKHQKFQIDSLVSYFLHAGDDNILAEAFFYAGRVYYEAGDKPESLKYYQKASEKVAKDNYALKGDIYCQMANVYKYTDLDKEALNALQLAYQADSLSQNCHNMLYDLRDIGEIYYDFKDINLSEKYFSKGLNMAELLKDSFMTRSFHHELAVICEERKAWEKALFHVNQYIQHVDEFPDNSGMLLTAVEVYKEIGNKELIEECERKIMASDNIFVKQEVYENILCSKIAKNTPLGIALHSYIQYTDSVINVNNAESVKKVEEIYNYEQKEKENHHLRSANIKKNMMIAFIVVVCLLVCLFSYMRIKNMKQQQEILKLKVDKYNSLKEKGRTTKGIENKLNVIKTSDIYNWIIQEKDNDSFKLDDTQWNSLKKLINDVYPNFDSNLKSFLDVTPQEYRVCLLLKIGITPTNIAKFMCLTKEAITASRRRMYYKAFHKKGTPAEWDRIIASL